MDNRQSQFDLLLGEIQAFKKTEELSVWLLRALHRGVPGVINLPARGERHILIEKLYKKCDPLFQIKFGNALALSLERFEPSATPDANELEYLYSLLSLAALIRNDQIKERLHRWIQMDAFHEWEHKTFNLYGVLILTTSEYDSNEEWLHHILKVLPTKAYFGEVAAAAYRAILETKGLDCIELLPDSLKTVELNDKRARSRFRILLSETMERCVPDFFFTTVARLLNSKERDVADVCLNVLKLENLIEEEFQNQKEFDKWTQYLGEKVWQPAIQRWRKAGTDPKTFGRILKECGSYAILRKGWIGAYRILIFNQGRHEITIKASDKKFAAFFERVDRHDEVANEPEMADAAEW